MQNIVKQKIMDLYPALTSDDVRTSMMSEAGADVKLTSAMARKLFPYSIECYIITGPRLKDILTLNHYLLLR